MTLARVRGGVRFKRSNNESPPSEIIAKTITTTTNSADYWAGVNSGETVLAADGTYTQGASIPDGVKLKAVNRGQAKFRGGDTGNSSGIVEMLGTGSTIDGLNVGQPDQSTSRAIKIEGSNNTVINTCGFDGGSHKHAIPLIISGTGHLIEDSWFFGTGRYTTQCFLAYYTTFRRCVMRWDDTIANNPGEPNAANVIYNSNNCTVENCISLDYGTPESAMDFGGDFYQSNHWDIATGPNDHNKYYGNMIVNHSVNTSNRNAFFFDGSYGGANANNNRYGIIEDTYINGNGIAVGLSTKFLDQPNGGADACKVGRTTIIDADAILGNVPRLADTSAAQNQFRYEDGVLTNESLWPWPNEALILADMSGPDNRRSTNPLDTTWQSASNTGYSAWIASGLSLTDYIGIAA